MFIGLAACGAGGEKQSGKATESPAPGGEAEKKQDGSSGEPKKIVFWNLYYNTQNESDKEKSKDELFVNKTARKFEELNPGVTAEVLSPPMDNYFNMLKAACVANNGPDIAMNWSGGPLMDYTQFFIPLDKYYTQEEIDEVIGWDLCRQDFKPDGQIMAVPVGLTGIFSMYYNKALFKKAGVDPERKPKTWDELLALCEDLKKGGVQPFVVGEKEGWNTAWIMGQLWYDLAGMDGYLAIRNGQKKFIEDETIKEAYAAWKKLYDLGYTNKDVMSLAQADGQARFLAGEAAIEVGISFIAKDVSNALGEDAGWFPFPHVRADAPHVNTYSGGIAGYCFSVTNFSKVPDEAVKYIKFMTSKETMDWFLDECQFDFSNNVKSKEPNFGDNPLLMDMWKYMKNTTDKGVAAWDNVLQGDLCQEMYNLNGSIFGGKISIEEALKKFDEKHASITKQ